MEEIRTYQERDEAQVVALWREVFGYPQDRNAPPRVIAEYLRHGHAGLFVAVDGAQVLGTLMTGYDGHRGWLYRLAVLPTVRRRGVASRLVDRALVHLRELGCAKVNLQLHTDNGVARGFWAAAGFGEEARVSMGKDLTVAGPTTGDAGC